LRASLDSEFWPLAKKRSAALFAVFFVFKGFLAGWALGSLEWQAPREIC